MKRLRIVAYSLTFVMFPIILGSVAELLPQPTVIA
jgi:hypothetical protein